VFDRFDVCILKIKRGNVEDVWPLDIVLSYSFNHILPWAVIFLECTRHILGLPNRTGSYSVRHTELWSNGQTHGISCGLLLDASSCDLSVNLCFLEMSRIV